MSDAKITTIDLHTAVIPVVGISDLIVHNWSAKSKREMIDGQNKVPKIKSLRDPEAEFFESLYLFPDGSYGFPSSGFKAAIVGACRQFSGIAMTHAKIMIFVRSEGEDVVNRKPLVHISGEVYSREDVVRLANGAPDLRYRAAYKDWSTTLHVVHNAVNIPLDMLLSLVNAGGLSGVGEWRPSSPKSNTGDFGMFEVDRSKDVQVYYENKN